MVMNKHVFNQPERVVLDDFTASAEGSTNIRPLTKTARSRRFPPPYCRCKRPPFIPWVGFTRHVTKKKNPVQVFVRDPAHSCELTKSPDALSTRTVPNLKIMCCADGLRRTIYVTA